MPSNIEIKARLANPDRTRALAEQLSDTPVEVLRQHDTFFTCAMGRLKLRELSSGEGQLIFYRRANVARTKQSDYLITATADCVGLRAVLSEAWGAQQTVIKTRLLYLLGQTRIHLDDVAGLGSFLELEVVLREGQPPAEGHRIACQLMTQLEIQDADLIDGAYADLLPTKDELQTLESL
jgi:predicted adenylyl cyclase CyaB